MILVVICLLLCDFNVMPIPISYVQRLWYVEMDDTLLEVYGREMCEFSPFGNL